MFLADSREMESFLNSDSVDLIVTGPPYWNEVVYSDQKGQLSTIENYQEFLNELAKVWQACSKILKPGGILALWIHDFFRKNGDGYDYVPFHSDILSYFPKGITLRNVVVWDRYLNKDRGKMPEAKPIGTRVQYVLVFQKDGIHHKNQALIKESLRKDFWQPVWRKKVHPSFLGSKFLFKILFGLGKTRTSPFALFNRSGLIKDEQHTTTYQTECPEEIAEKLIKNFSTIGDTVLDPFLGSGTTMKVALDLNRRFVGVEINPNAVNSIAKKVGKNRYEVRVSAS